jgi:asparagine synthase (glutamine-hydrolysing)
LISWGLALRRPVLSLLAETLGSFAKATGSARSVAPLPWLCAVFVRENASAISGYPRRTRIFGPRPSFQENLSTLEALRRQLASFPLSPDPPYRKAYPYLDRDLLEFLFALPPDQLVRPNQRRSLMRRALASIVPQELLNRKRKAFVIRGPLAAIAAREPQFKATTRQMLATSLGIIDSTAFAATLCEVHSGGIVSVPAMVRTFAIERWLRNVAHHGVFDDLHVRFPLASVAANAAGREFTTSLS